MWIVKIALNRPYTFIVLALLILLISPLVILRTPIDIFPNVNIPVIAVLWNYTGLNAEEMEERIAIAVSSAISPPRSTTSSTSNRRPSNGRSIIKVFFHPNVEDRDGRGADDCRRPGSPCRQMPPGTTPPFILIYNASSVPILQLALSGEGLSRAATVRLRHQLHPYPARHASRARRFPSPTAASSAR